MAGWEWRGRERTGRNGMAGVEWSRQDENGLERTGRNGEDWKVEERSGRKGMLRRETERLGKARNDCITLKKGGSNALHIRREWTQMP